MTIVITGATGNVGRPLVAELAAAGARVRAVTRTPKTARFPDGVEVVGSAADALSGASAVFLNSRALGEDLADVVAQCRTGRGRQAGCAVGHQRRRRLLPAAVTFSR